jgi:hypothetical protein
MALTTKREVGGEAQASPPSSGEKKMPTKKTEVAVRVLNPQAFLAVGVDPGDKDEVTVDEATAAWAVASGYGERVKPLKTETA